MYQTGRRKSAWSTALITLAMCAALTGRLAHAETQTYTETVEVSGSLGLGSLSPQVAAALPQFNPALGTLQGVDARVQTTSTSLTLTVTNASAGTVSFTYTRGLTSQSVTVPPFGNLFAVAVSASSESLAPGASLTDTSSPFFAGIDVSHEIPEFALSDYTGTETVSLTASSSRTAEISDVEGGADALVVSGSWAASVEFTVTYTYEPRPVTFACYSALAAERLTPVTVTLADEFREATVTVARATSLCNALETRDPEETAAAAIRPRGDHLVAYAIAQSAPPKFAPIFGIQVEDQFGTRFVDALTPDRLLVPSAVAIRPEERVGPAPSVLNPFVCYTVQTAAGSPRFARIPGVEVRDEFGTRLVDLAKLSRFCNPVGRAVETLVAGPRSQHLMCYETQPAQGAPRFTAVGPIRVDNEFGRQELKATTPGELCVSARTSRDPS